MTRYAILLAGITCGGCSFDPSTAVLADESTDPDRADEMTSADASSVGGDAASPNQPDAGKSAPDAAGCPSGYSPKAGTCIRLGSAASWLSAEQDCESDIAGAHLVIISSADELSALPNNIWIGLYEKNADGQFVTVTNQSPPFTSWAGGEPGAGGGLCVENRADGWHDDGCTESKAYACEYDGVAAVPSAYGQ